jgi:hypothetical protein
MTDDTTSRGRPLRLRSEDLHWREVDGEVIVLDVTSATYFATGRSGALLWRALVDGARPDELAGVLAAEFDLDPATAREDADRFVAELRARGLLADEERAAAS